MGRQVTTPRNPFDDVTPAQVMDGLLRLVRVFERLWFVPRRVDLNPEPTSASDRYDAQLTSGLTLPRIAIAFDLPAAGHLGVQEVTCRENHDGALQLHSSSCPACKASV